MNDIDINAIQKEGANARVLGISCFDNKYKNPELMPKNTGESIETWERKFCAWELGWIMEDSIRS